MARKREPAAGAEHVSRPLLAWFRRHARDLPWRRRSDPYAIWVSEVMLQQTQAATVVRFFDRFLSAFPTIADLAAASSQDVLRQWEGLGYYRRARALHVGARHIVRHHQGRLPDDPAVLRRLPGFGPYTTGAVLSQAFDRRLPILEANSQRVLCRLFGIRQDPRRGAVRTRLWQLAEALLPQRAVGQFNQAMMELGALVCVPLNPRCDACPLTDRCQARRLGLQGKIPLRARSPQPIAVTEVAAILRRRERVLLVQRPAQGLWAGLWEFPHRPLEAGETHEQAAQQLLRALGFMAESRGQLGTIRHSVTRYRITLTGMEAVVVRGVFRSSFYRAARWLEPAQLAEFPLSSPQRRLARLLTRQAGGLTS